MIFSLWFIWLTTHLGVPMYHKPSGVFTQNNLGSVGWFIYIHLPNILQDSTLIYCSNIKIISSYQQAPNPTVPSVSFLSGVSLSGEGVSSLRGWDPWLFFKWSMVNSKMTSCFDWKKTFWGGDDVQSFENIGKTNDLFPTRLRSAVGWRFDVDRSGIRRTNSSG